MGTWMARPLKAMPLFRNLLRTHYMRYWIDQPFKGPVAIDTVGRSSYIFGKEKRPDVL